MKTSKKHQIGCGLGAKFGPNYVQCCEKSKETGNIIKFFSYFTWDCLLKQEAVVVKPAEWKFIAIIARNAEVTTEVHFLLKLIASYCKKKTAF